MSSYRLKKPGLIFYALLIILLLGFCLRIFNIYSIPAGFFCDEASVGFNAYSILKTGKDEHGFSYPFFFKAFGEYKSPVETYSTVPLVAIFGLNELSVRLTSIIYGLLSIIAIFLLAREFFKNKNKRNITALISALFLAISPWAIHFSRVSLEGLMPFVFYTTFGLYLLQKSQEVPKVLPVSIASFALALYSYFPARIFIPFFGIGLALIYFRFFLTHKKVLLVGIIVLGVLLIPFIQNLSSTGLERWKQVNIFSNPPAKETVAHHIFNNYILHFSPAFLFQYGDIGMTGQNITRHSVRGIGELYLFQLPLILLGIFSLFRSGRKLLLVLVLWLILYPAGSMFTTDSSPQATRSIIGVIPFQILSAVGVVFLLHIFSRLFKPAYYTLTGIIVILISVSFIQFFSLYFITYPNYSSDYWGWQFGPREIIGYYLENKPKYDELIMSADYNSPEIFLKFYAPEDCTNCRIGLPDNSYDSNKRQLFAVTPDYINNHSNFKYSLVKTIYYPNGNAAFILTEIVP